MHHATPLITTIVGGLVLAFILGMIANKLRISPLVGYRHSRRCRSDSGGDAAGYGAFRRAGMVINDRHRFWALSVYSQ